MILSVARPSGMAERYHEAAEVSKEMPEALYCRMRKSKKLATSSSLVCPGLIKSKISQKALSEIEQALAIMSISEASVIRRSHSTKPECGSKLTPAKVAWRC